MSPKNITKEKYESLLHTNARLNEQIKALTLKNEDLMDHVRELEMQIKELSKKIKEPYSKKEERRRGITVLYAIFDGYKDIKEGEHAQQMYDVLDEIFMRFDQILERHKLERIRSIGDHYVCAGGIAEKKATNPIDICLAALQMHLYFDELADKYKAQGKEFWTCRIGIHSGNGLVESHQGSKKKKTSYVLSGEVLNTAPRITNICEPGEIFLSDYTYEIIKSFFQCEYSGELPAKYRGNLALYKLNRIKKQYSEDRKTGAYPNDQFILKYHLKEFNDLEDKVLNFLQEKLPEHLYYHDYRHTIDVVNQAELIGYGEGVSDEQILLLKTAALFHDTGHTISSPGHEELSCDIAREWLRDYNYSDSQIEQICDVIMATKMPPNPKTLLQRIICDSDLDYLGRTDFIPTSNALFKELEAQGIMSDINEWNKLQVKFLSDHQFYTKTSVRLREVNKQAQIERIEKLIAQD